MVRVRFTANLRRHCDGLAEVAVSGTSVRTCLEAVFERYPALRGFVLDDQGGLRRHMTLFIDSEQVVDRRTLADAVPPEAMLDIYQALSGG